MNSVTRITGISSGMDTESLVKSFSSRYTAQKDKLWKQKQSLQYKQDAWKDMNKDIYNLYTKLFTNKLKGTYQKTEIISSDEKIAKVSGNNENAGIQSLSVDKMASQTFITGQQIEKKEPMGLDGTLTVIMGGHEQDLNITPDMSMEQIARKLTQAGIAANFDENNMRLFLSSKSTGAKSDFDVCGDASLMAALGLGPSATKTIGQDAMVTLNGVQFISETNRFNINGFNIDACSIGSVNIETKTENSIFNTIKDFIEDYNTLIKKIDKAYNTSRDKYTFLTNEEKEVLSEKEADEWDQKLKDSVLYKDETLYKISNLLKNTMQTADLYSIGLSLGDYFTTEKNERGVYKLDEDKLKSVINTNPEKVIDIMTKLSSNLYNNLDKEMKSTSFSSVYTVYNDKQMKEELKDYDKRIADWEKKIESIEDKYYKKFAQMETLLSSMQNQSNYFSNFF